MKHLRNGIPLLMLLLCMGESQGAAPRLPPWLPRYDLDIRLDVARHSAHVRQRVTWTNRHAQETNKLVFNVHSRYRIPDEDVGFMAKTLELLRVHSSEGLITQGRACQLNEVLLLQGAGNGPLTDAALDFQFQGDTDTSMVVKLPQPIKQGESVTILLDFELHLPQKMGRWGQWRGVTFLTNWLPVLAYYDEQGWMPTPFIPWHQPFFNESGIYTARVVLPSDQQVACTGYITQTTDRRDGWKELAIEAKGVRDFAFLCSPRYVEHSTVIERGKGCAPLTLRVLAFPEHKAYAEKMLKIAAVAMPTYERWFGPYPFPVLTITEAFFGWNGNECSTLIMIDERVFGMPSLAEDYVDYLLSHEICHQWWYNVVGTNGFAETWMDEALATYFSHQLMNRKHGKDNELLRYPKGLKWLPNIRRRDYRSYGLYGTIGRGANGPVIRKMPEFGHLANLFNLCYDKGSRIVGMIAERLGKTAFLDFTRIVYKRYSYRILRVQDYQRELEEYTGEDWDEFFQYWLYGEGLCDWSVKKVRIERLPESESLPAKDCECPHPGIYRAVVHLEQTGNFSEQTTLGVSFGDGETYPLRVPIIPQLRELQLEEMNCKVQAESPNEIRVELVLPCKPTQFVVDPDQILVDKNPLNNYWRKPIRVRLTPLYTSLEETDLTNAYDRWNILLGPWVFRPAAPDPWYTRSTLFGIRAGAYRTQKFNGGAYLAYRTEFRDVVVGADGLLDHALHPKLQFGFNAEQRLTTFQSGPETASRGSLFGRYILQHGSSLYLPNFEYVQAFAAYQDNFLPFVRNRAQGGQRFDHSILGGIHYHKNYLTPYWDPAGGYALDVTYAGGEVNLPDGAHDHHQLSGQFSYVQFFPDLTKWWDTPLTEWLSDTRVAVRAFGAAGGPDQGEYFALGGGTLFRGYDQAERQGSVAWIGSLEWRIPMFQDVRWDFCDHVLGIRNVHTAVFYDVGDTYTNGRSVGPVAHAVGGGLRVDVAIFGFIERAVLRLDVAKTVNDDTPVQFWFGLSHPF